MRRKGNHLLTATQLKNAKPKAKEYKLFDGDSLYCHISPIGNKNWRVRYKHLGKESAISLGQYPAVSLADARKKRDEIKQQVASGKNPVTVKEDKKRELIEKTENTFGAVSLKWFEEKRRNWSPATIRKYSASLKNDIEPWIASRPISELTNRDYVTVINRAKRDGYSAADTVRKICLQIQKYAKSQDRITVVFPLIDTVTTVNVTHRAATKDPDTLADILRKIDGYAGRGPVGKALQLAPHLFVRPGELVGMRWSDICLESKQWIFKVPKKKHSIDLIVPLSEPVIVMLKEIRLLTGNGIYVFPNERDSKRHIVTASLNAALKQSGVDPSIQTPHGFRSTAQSMIHEKLGIGRHITEAQLGHVPDKNLGRAYDRAEYLPERREMMSRWSGYLYGLRSPAEVIQLDEHRKKKA